MSRTQKLFRFLFLPATGLALIAALIFEVGGVGASSVDADSAASTADPTSVPAAHSRVLAEGRLTTYPGGEVVVGTDVAGRIARLDLQEKQQVKRGALVAEIAADDLAAELAEARAKVAEADAERRLSEIEVRRAEQLLASAVDTQSRVDRTRRDQEVAAARVATAEAEVARLAAKLAKYRILAPIDGTVVVRHADAGETVAAEAPLVTLADLTRTRIEAEIDEFDAGRIAVGAPVVVTAEGFDGERWRGTVEEIPVAVSGRKLKPQDPGKPQDTRVLLVKIRLEEPTPLKLGQRAEVEIGG
ncbi:MAG: efflux RND transporter periplasmic adaptor subunit [Thermoanaerobaculia bacterium]